MNDMQKIIILCVIALVFIGGIFYYILNVPNSPEEAASTGESASMEMPVQGDEGVDEMVAETDEGSQEPTVTEGTDVGMDISIDANAKVFTITGKPFEFSMSEIRVQEGDTVTINFESTEGLHDWVVDEFDAATAHVQAGSKTSVTFVADKKGSFEYYCSVGSHRQLGMVGTIIVE